MQDIKIDNQWMKSFWIINAHAIPQCFVLLFSTTQDTSLDNVKIIISQNFLSKCDMIIFLAPFTESILQYA